MFRVMLCIIMAVAVAQAWVELSPVLDPAQVGTGSAITYGNGKLWGVFPNEDSDWTYFEYYDPGAPGWVYPDDDLDYLENTAITFQWMNDGAVFVVGVEDGDPTLYWYDLADPFWDEEEIENFSLGAGASIAFRPVPVYRTMDHVPGWLYCLAGNGQEFWRYSIPGFGGPEAVDGICPGQGAVIADQTPHFSWQGTGAAQYRLMISTDPLFSATGTDVVVSATQYDVTNPMENGTYYWRTGTQNELSWSWSSTHSFDLEGGWTPLADIPVAVSSGAALAYEKDYYGPACLIALVGGGGHGCYHYIVSQDTWVESSWTVPYQNVGTALVTHEAAGPAPLNWPGPWAIFGEWSDCPYYHGLHFGWWADTLPDHALPQSLGPGASLAYSVESDRPYLYLIVGESAGTARNNFYRLALPVSEDGGEQAGSVQPASAAARLINGSGKVTVEYELSAPARMKATVFDAVGRQIKVLHSGPQPAGVHQLCWDTEASDHRTCSGAYFIVLNTGDEQVRLKAVVR